MCQNFLRRNVRLPQTENYWCLVTTPSEHFETQITGRIPDSCPLPPRLPHTRALPSFYISTIWKLLSVTKSSPLNITHFNIILLSLAAREDCQAVPPQADCCRRQRLLQELRLPPHAQGGWVRGGGWFGEDVNRCMGDEWCAPPGC